MRKHIMLTVGVFAAGFAVPAAAQDYGYGYGYQSQHQLEHDQLDHQRRDLHHQLRDRHEDAHEQGLDPWTHAQLHQDLRAQHQYYDHQRRHEHRREHQWNQSQRYYGDGFSPYGY